MPPACIASLYGACECWLALTNALAFFHLQTRRHQSPRFVMCFVQRPLQAVKRYRWFSFSYSSVAQHAKFPPFRQRRVLGGEHNVRLSIFPYHCCHQGMLANEKSKGMGDQEEGMDLADEVDMGGKVRAFATFSVMSLSNQCHSWTKL